jgi:hypothetical protein
VLVRRDELLPRIGGCSAGLRRAGPIPRRADDYYLAEDSGVASRYVASPLTGVRRAGSLTGEAYKRWGRRLRRRDRCPEGAIALRPSALRFVEVVVNGPKSWSLAVALHPAIADALDAAQTRGRADHRLGLRARHHPGAAQGPTGAGARDRDEVILVGFFVMQVVLAFSDRYSRREVK